MASVGLIYAVFVITMRLSIAAPIDGWASLIVVVLTLGGTQMVMLGILGEYLVRTLRESRRRPRYFLEHLSDSPDSHNTRCLHSPLSLPGHNCSSTSPLAANSMTES